MGRPILDRKDWWGRRSVAEGMSRMGVRGAGAAPLSTTSSLGTRAAVVLVVALLAEGRARRQSLGGETRPGPDGGARFLAVGASIR